MSKLSIENLNLYYGDFHALKNINMEIEAGKITAFIGPSGCGKSTLLEMIVNVLPNGPMYYPEDQLLDQPERFVVSEIIREKVLLNTDEEVPHSVAITIERFKEQSDKVEIYATIVVERLSQKKIVIGKNGSMIKKIGTQARLDIKKFLGCGVHLDLFVKVEENWRNKKFHLKEFGFANDDM